MTGEGLRNLFLQVALAPELDLKFESVGAANCHWCQQCKAGTRWATPAFCRHLGTMYTYGWTRKFHGWLKWHNEIRFNLKNYCITVWHRRPKVLRGLLSVSFHSKFLNFGLLIHSVSWGWVCILYLRRGLFSSFVQIQQSPKSNILQILMVEDGRILARV